GRGYPDGLKGEEIPLAARILAVADAFDAMTSDRVYRAGLAVDEAVEELIRNKGTKFDPRVGDGFVEEVLPRKVELPRQAAARRQDDEAREPRGDQVWRTFAAGDGEWRRGTAVINRAGTEARRSARCSWTPWSQDWFWAGCFEGALSIWRRSRSAASRWRCSASSCSLSGSMERAPDGPWCGSGRRCSTSARFGSCWR